ncbi:MAG: ABC transporter substrate-binding protein [Desulfuromonadales bacterium]|nr:ABC transporter substrate-binding protein [Desulfuromonadales bacterium]
MIKRMTLSALVALSLLLPVCLPTRAQAQQTVAAIIVADLPRYAQAYQAMVTVLRAGGFDESKLKIFTQKPNADKMSLINSLRRCQSANVDLVVTFGARATAAAMEELKGIPLLFADVYDPVALGVVKTLEAPGTDATGASSKTDLSALVAAVRQLQTISKVGVIFSEGEPGSEQQLAELRKLSGQLGFSVIAENARNPKESLSMAEKLAATCDAVYLTESIAAMQQGADISARLATTTALFSQIPGLVEAGALVGLEADPDEQGKLVAVQALQILQGQKAHILPVRPAKKISLLINRATAASLGVEIPPGLAAEATQVK